MYLGLDLSLSNSGICVLDNDGKIIKVTSVITDNEGESIRNRFERYYQIISHFGMVLDEYIKDIKIVSIEMYSYASSGRIVQLVEGGTLVRDYILKNNCNCKIIEVAPISLKKFILGTVKNKGQAAKNILCREIYKKYGAEIDDDNQVDAFILAMVAKCFYDIENNLNKENYLKYQQEVVLNLMKKKK